MRKVKPGRRINKRQQGNEVEKDQEIAAVANGLKEYMIDESSSPCSSQSSSSNGHGDSDGSTVQFKVPSVSGSSNSNQGGNSNEKKNWKMDDFYRIYASKEYISSYLYLMYDGEWIKIYGTIAGENLRVIKVPDSVALQSYEPEPTVELILSKELSISLETVESLKRDVPLFIYCIKDSISQVLPLDYRNEVAPPPPIPYTCFFRIDSYIFASSSYIAANSWTHAVRLSAYEYGLLNVYFSFTLLRVVPYIRIWSDFEIKPFKTKRVKNFEWDGECRIKFGITNEWTDFYCKISSAVYESVSKPGENTVKPSGLLKFFKRKKSNEGLNSEGKSEKKPNDILVKPSQMAFYSSSSDCKKGLAPKFIFQNVVFVYALWPNTMDLKSDVVTEIKIMGSLNFGVEDSSLEPDKDMRDLSNNIIFLQSANTHESLHWLVSILGAFALNADLNSSDSNAAVWSSTLSDWGALCLSLDEIAGLSASGSLVDSFIEYAKLLSAKKGMLRTGLLAEWQSSVRDSVQTRKSYERKEVELKANVLVRWIDQLKNGESSLPNFISGGESVFADSGEDTSASANQYAGKADDREKEKENKLKNNGSDVSPRFRRASNSRQVNAAKKLITGLSAPLPKTFESNLLPSSLWYQQEENRIKEWEERALIPDQESSAENIQIYGANSLIEKDAQAQAVKKTGLESFRITEKQGPIFAENSLLEKTFRESSQLKADGPLVGQIQKGGNKPKLEGGLLGQMDLREKEFENFRKAGGYRATMLPPSDSVNLSQSFQTQGLPPDSVTQRHSSIGTMQPNLIMSEVRPPLSNMVMIPHMDLRISAYQDPKASLVGQPFDPRISFMGRPLDPRFSLISTPSQIDQRFSINSNEMNFSNVPSLRNEKSNAYTDKIRLSSIRSKTLSDPPSAKSSESDNSDETSSKDVSGTESTSGGDDSSCTSSSKETNENLFEQLDKESIGSSSVTSSDDDSENSKSLTAALNFVQIPYPGMQYPLGGMPLAPPPQQYSEGQYLSQYSGSNFPVPPRRQESKSIASKSNTVSSSSGSEEEVHNLNETANSDSGTESESSVSADESSVKKKSRSVLLPGKKSTE